MPLSSLPDLADLTAGLRTVWDSSANAAVTVLDRQPNLYASTFASEIVTCRLPDGSRRRLFCKYSADQDTGDFGHRGGVPYEAEVYRQVLEPLQSFAGISGSGPRPTARFYGSFTDPRTGVTGLVLEYLEGAWLMDETAEAEPEVLAARWAGRFHAAAEARLARTPPPFLTAHGPAYYRGWARRTAELARHWGPQFPWLVPLCRRCPDVVVPLLTAAPTVIHGEYYPLNILVRDGAAYPIDWESAAWAAGEIDLASLTEDWPGGVVARCEREYREARWPGGAPADFEGRLAAGRLYLALRWLADEPCTADAESIQWYVDHLRQAGERLGMM